MAIIFFSKKVSVSNAFLLEQQGNSVFLEVMEGDALLLIKADHVL